jgi:hypothetical protein
VASGGRYERRQGIEATVGYRDGFGKERRLSLSVGIVTVRRPRVRGLVESFESRIRPLFKRRPPAVSELLSTLSLHGLPEGDFHGVQRHSLSEKQVDPHDFPFETCSGFSRVAAIGLQTHPWWADVPRASAIRFTPPSPPW